MDSIFTTRAGRIPAYRIGDLPEKIARQIVIDPDSGCWLWQGLRDRLGYGHLYWDHGYWLSHRLVYTLLVDPVPRHLVMDHVKAWGCRNTACCWPAHLEPVTQRENLLRGNTFGAANVAKTHCPQGHPYDEANTYVSPSDGGRHCRTCMGWKGGIAAALRTHCKSGHEFTPENTYIVRAKGRKPNRACRTCKRDRMRGAWKGGLPMGERTHCPKGHEYTPENTYINPGSGGRVCRACQTEAQRRYQARKQAKAA
jgi:hypothetical protein